VDLLPVRSVQRGVALRLLVEVGGEADGPALRRRRVHQLSDGREHSGDGIVVGGELLLDARFELIEAPGEILVRAQEFAQLNEGAHDVDPHLDGARTVEHVGGLNRAMFGERMRQVTAAAAPGEGGV
jgi:hypothetical protein